MNNGGAGGAGGGTERTKKEGRFGEEWGGGLLPVSKLKLQPTVVTSKKEMASTWSRK